MDMNMSHRSVFYLLFRRQAFILFLRDMKKVLFFLTCVLGLFGVAVADGGPKPWQMDFMPAATPVMEDIIELHNLLRINKLLELKGL